MSHTPGPWSSTALQPEGNVWIYGSVGPNRPRIANVEFGLNYGQDVPVETVANAQLIAASPEMVKVHLHNLATLQDTRRRLQAWGKPHHEIDVAIRETETVIKLAIGR